MDDVLEGLFQWNLPSTVESYVITINEGGRPPLLESVIAGYQSVVNDLNWSWQLAELVEYCVHDKPRTPQVIDRLHWLDRLGASNQPAFVINPYVFEPLDLEAPNYSQPLARVIRSEHLNPLETIIAVSAASLILILTGLTWSIRKWRQSKLDEQIVEARAGVIEAIARIVANGNENQIRAVIPIAKGIWNDGIAQPSSDKFTVDVAKTLKMRGS